MSDSDEWSAVGVALAMRDRIERAMGAFSGDGGFAALRFAGGVDMFDEAESERGDVLRVEAEAQTGNRCQRGTARKQREGRLRGDLLRRLLLATDCDVILGANRTPGVISVGA